ncbi:hypothetical protein JAAARDRAFT_110387, partial [Jaapia argillacea MUCL 33604]
GKKATTRGGSIFGAFARQGQQPVTVSHRSHTNAELMTAGRPGLSLPSPSTVARDIHSSFGGCRNHIKILLRDHPGRLNFATDAWTSPNHRAFLAWTVHLEYEGSLLSFVLDIVEVPEVCPV